MKLKMIMMPEEEEEEQSRGDEGMIYKPARRWDDVDAFSFLSRHPQVSICVGWEVDHFPTNIIIIISHPITIFEQFKPCFVAHHSRRCGRLEKRRFFIRKGDDDDGENKWITAPKVCPRLCSSATKKIKNSNPALWQILYDGISHINGQCSNRNQ